MSLKNHLSFLSHVSLKQWHSHTHTHTHTHFCPNNGMKTQYARTHRKGGERGFFWWWFESFWINYIPSKDIISVPENKTQTLKTHISYEFVSVCGYCACIVSVFNHILKETACFETFLFYEAIWKEKERRGEVKSEAGHKRRCISTCEGLDTDFKSPANVMEKTMKI